MNTLLLTFGFLLLAASAVYSQGLPDNVNYLANLTIADNESKVKYYNLQVKLTENRFKSFIESLRYKNHFIENTLYDQQRNLTATGFENSTNQNCVIRYGKLPELTVVKKAINNCIDTAFSDSALLFRKVKKDLENAKGENDFLRAAIEGCSYKAKYVGVDCASLKIEKSNKYVRDNLNSADRGFQLALAGFDDLSKNTVECTSDVVRQLASDIEDVRRTLESCQKTRL